MLKARGIVGARIDTKTGDAVFEGPNERRKYLKMMGQYDRSGLLLSGDLTIQRGTGKTLPFTSLATPEVMSRKKP